MRIVTITPGAAEIAIALGLESAIVAASVDCRLPERIRGVERIGTSAVDDYESRERFVEQIARFKNAAVLTTNLAPAIRHSLESITGLHLVDLQIKTIDEMFTAIEAAGDSLRAGSAAKLALRGLSYRRRRVESVSVQLEHESRPRVLFLEGLNPLIGAGLWNPELVALAGGRNLHGRAAAAPRKTQFEHISVLDPDVIFVAANSLEYASVRSEIDALAEANSDWGVLRAVAHDRIFIAEAEGNFDTPGPSMIDGLELLAYTLHPHRYEKPTAADDLLHVKRADAGLSQLTNPTDD